jgi:hypothetical protein
MDEFEEEDTDPEREEAIGGLWSSKVMVLVKS